ncbi:hypothetical protein [Rosistilla ulvae]|uniref:hypothetical protein n=1 Tax=Rosistilla ulvae TaxID=1930277 RepID=UPI001FEB5DA8|nr:hypothetical protein [Rosistilla ulvae]
MTNSNPYDNKQLQIDRGSGRLPCYQIIREKNKVTITRVGSNEAYADGWSKAFSSGKATKKAATKKATKKVTTARATKKAATKKTATKKVAVKAAAKKTTKKKKR